MRILAVDPSLTGTGLAYGATIAPGALVRTIKPPRGLDSIQRLRFIRDAAATEMRHALGGHVDLVTMEGPAYGAQRGAQQGHHERAGLWWMIREAADLADIDVAIVPPTTLKKYATGKGNATKDDVLIAAVQRLPMAITNNNEADAAWLYAMAADRAGTPIVSMPARNRDSLEAVEWPA